MTPKTRKALEGSIRKWEGIVTGSVEDHGEDNCPLCKLFRKADVGCTRCPVKKATGKDWCKGSPYQRWLHLTDGNVTVGRSCGEAINPQQKRAALVMLRFLEDLRP